MNRRIPTAVAGLMILVLAAGGCSRPPDLGEIETAFAPGTAGAGAGRVDDSLAGTAFGQRIARAIAESPELARSTARLRMARAELRGASGAFLPEISLGASAETRSLGGAQSSSASPYLKVSQLVYDGGAAASARTAARARVFETRGTRLEVVSAATLKAVETYHAVRTRRRLLDLANDNLSVLETVAGQIGGRVAGGLGAQTDMLTARSRLADARTRRIDAQARLDRAAAEYRRIFGQPPDDLPPPQPAPALPADAEAVIAQSPRVRSIDARLMAARAELAAARARRLPSVSLEATGQRTDGEGDVSLGLSLNYALDSAGKRAAAITAAQARIEEIAADRRALRREIRQALDFVRSDQQAGAARVAAARAAVEANARNVAAARDQFTVGRSSLIQILDAQRDYVAARETLILAEQDRALTDFAALALTGDILDTFRITLPQLPGGAS